MKDKLSELIKSGKVNLKDYVVIVPLKMYEQLIADCKDVEENELVEGCDLSVGHYPRKLSTTDKMSN